MFFGARATDLLLEVDIHPCSTKRVGEKNINFTESAKAHERPESWQERQKIGLENKFPHSTNLRFFE